MSSEYRAARKILKKYGSIKFYLESIFTQMELINLTSNWVYLVLRVFTISMPGAWQMCVVEVRCVSATGEREFRLAGQASFLLLIRYT